MGKYWTTPEQRVWLSGHTADFLEAQESTTVDRFFKELNKKWFVAYPEVDYAFPCAPGTTRRELTDAENVLLSKAKVKRKAMLRTWMNWHPSKKGRIGSKPNLKSFKSSLLSTKNTRMPQR
ncbi:hypothetical protein BD779DRAFT_1679145 [Infundibulicybe gibba]|nr:hypothetical protein BD779DRAFT_1679145 [Infundibulicybe gibba]